MIKNDEKFRQSLLFEGLRLDPKDKRTGTDIDFEYEDGKIWIKCEVKEYGKNITTGQKILFERFHNNLKNYKVFCFLLWHKKQPSEDIYIKDCIVSKLYHNNKWINVIDKQGERTFKEIFNEIAK